MSVKKHEIIFDSSKLYNDKNMITLFFRLANALGDARDNVIAEVGKENSTSELLFYLEKVCDGMIERYSIGAEINER